MKKFFVLLMSLTLCFSSCSKEDNDPILNDPELNGGVANNPNSNGGVNPGSGTSINNDDPESRYADYKGTVSYDDFGGLVIGGTLVRANGSVRVIKGTEISDYYYSSVKVDYYSIESGYANYIVMPNITKIAKGCFKRGQSTHYYVWLKKGAKIEFESDALEGVDRIYYYDEYIPKSSN